jgi:hypothetical protein
MTSSMSTLVSLRSPSSLSLLLFHRRQHAQQQIRALPILSPARPPGPIVESSSGAEIPSSTPPASRSPTLAGVTVGAEVRGSSGLVKATKVGSEEGGFDRELVGDGCAEGLVDGIDECTTGAGLGGDDWTERNRGKTQTMRLRDPTRIQHKQRVSHLNQNFLRARLPSADLQQ